MSTGDESGRPRPPSSPAPATESRAPAGEAGRWVRALAPAKINPTLEVLGRRPDGYHELRTSLLALELCDVVGVRALPRGAPALTVRVEGPFATPDVPSDERNLAARAVRLVLAGLGADAPALELVVEKNVPSQAGLGGGSADAAAALLAAQTALGVPSDVEASAAALADLGSDCPFFLLAARTGAASCEGRGERVTPLASPEREWWIAVITPETRCSTAAVYASLDCFLSPPGQTPSFPLEFGTTARRARGRLVNHLESAALAAVPSLTPWREALTAAGAGHFLLAGSGSSFFGLFDTRAEAELTLAAAMAAARARTLAWRGAWVTRPAGHGAKLV